MIPLHLFATIAHALPRRIAELLDVMAGDVRWRVGGEVVTTFKLSTDGRVMACFPKGESGAVPFYFMVNATK